MLDFDGRVYSFGDNLRGELASLSCRCGAASAWRRTRPRSSSCRSPRLRDVRMVDIVVGSHQSVALSDKGAVFHWGTHRPSLDRPVRRARAAVRAAPLSRADAPRCARVAVVCRRERDRLVSLSAAWRAARATQRRARRRVSPPPPPQPRRRGESRQCCGACSRASRSRSTRARCRWCASRGAAEPAPEWQRVADRIMLLPKN
jgi:hypothetical protein